MRDIHAVALEPVTPAIVPTGSLESLGESFALHLRAMNRSGRTIQSYLEAIGLLGAFLRSTGRSDTVEDIRRADIEEFLAEQLRLWRPSTARARFAGLKQFFKWLHAENELRSDPMERMKPPSVPAKPPEVVSTDGLRALLRACEGVSFEDRRDMAIVRFFIDTGAR